MSRPSPASRAPIVVVGAGVAGLATALAAAPAPVVLLCRDPDGRGSASAMAQGGIAAAMAASDSVRAHAADTLAAGAGHNRATMVEWLCAQGPATVAWLAGQGVAFDRDEAGRLLLGREGGHRTARIVHAGGDATGAAIVRALQAQARTSPHIQWRGGLDVEALLLRGGEVRGVRARGPRGEQCELQASAVVLATGGIGALFARTSNPSGADGAGLALAQLAGAQLRDLEFMQFHPTALAVEGQSLPLLTEALRGAGAVLRDHRGQPLMAGMHPMGDLAPRDIVARRVWQAQVDGPVWLDASGVEGDWTRRFPTVLDACLAHGLDPRHQWLPVTPAAHFHMGGIAVDDNGDSSVPGLHAVGEAACTGAHGANRLASNSLLEGVACGRKLGASLAQANGSAGRGPFHWRELGPSLAAAQHERLRALTWSAAGPLRTQAQARHAVTECTKMQDDGWQARLARAMFLAVLERRHSLGAHCRVDLIAAMRHRMAEPT